MYLALVGAEFELIGLHPPDANEFRSARLPAATRSRYHATEGIREDMENALGR